MGRLFTIPLLNFFVILPGLLASSSSVQLAADETRSLLLTTLHNFSAPVGYQIQVSCSAIRLKACVSVEIEFTNDGGAAEWFCQPTVVRLSLFNYVRLAVQQSASHICQLKTVKREQCDCGWNTQAKIVNGNETAVNEFPSMAAFRFIPIDHYFCGGTIISERCILTAAHCFQVPAYQNNTEVIVGGHVKHQLHRYTQVIAMQDVFVHEGYNASNQTNDIAIVQLVRPIHYTRGVGPACLPFGRRTEDFFHLNVELVGWGMLTYRGKMSTTYRKVALSVMETETCEKKIPWVDETKLCTFMENKDACQSDSGGPCFFTNSRQWIVAIISFGIECATDAPGVNTSVMRYLDWIIKHAKCSDFCDQSRHF